MNKDDASEKYKAYLATKGLRLTDQRKDLVVAASAPASVSSRCAVPVRGRPRSSTGTKSAPASACSRASTCRGARVHVPASEPIADCTRSAPCTTGSVAAAPERTAAICRVGKDPCITCHMPKYDLPGGHFKFTDHHIRIAKPGDQYPN